QLPSGSTTPDNKTASHASKEKETSGMRGPDEEAPKTAPREPEERPRTEAPPPKAEPAPVTRGIAEPWDVVPVFYGTDRGRQQLGASTTYGTERARRLELGRALVTVPKAHQIPNIERPWVYRLPFTQIILHSEPEDPRQHFTLKDVRALSKEEFLQLI